MSETFVAEPTKDTDSSVNPSIINDGSLLEVWENFKDGNSGNRFTDYNDFLANVAVFARAEDTYIVSGKAYSGFG